MSRKYFSMGVQQNESHELAEGFHAFMLSGFIFLVSMETSTTPRGQRNMEKIET